MMMSINRNHPTILFLRRCILLHIKFWWKIPFPALKNYEIRWLRKAKEFMHVVKIGRTHFMDATPLTVGQEFSGYVSQLDHGLKAINNTLAAFGELALGGTAVGTGINTPDSYAENVAATYCRTHRASIYYRRK